MDDGPCIDGGIPVEDPVVPAFETNKSVGFQIVNAIFISNGKLCC